MAYGPEVPAEENAPSKSRLSPPPLPSASEICILKAGDYLYKVGEVKSFVYRVEKGVVAVINWHDAKSAEIFALASKGDFVGLGCFDEHIDDARAIVDCIVSGVTRSEFGQLAEHNPKLRQQQGEKIEIEFEYRKELLSNRERATPIARVAAFLIAVSHQNSYEGREPAIISDSFKCGVVASLLGLDVSTLGHILHKLEVMNLVEYCPSGAVRLKDIAALECVADEQPEATARGFCDPIDFQALSPVQFPLMQDRQPAGSCLLRM